jgi:hypothetical protein
VPWAGHVFWPYAYFDIFEYTSTRLKIRRATAPSPALDRANAQA